MTDQPQTFAELCRAERDRRYWTQQEIADLIGVHWRTFHRWEAGESLPRRAEAKCFAQGCNIPLAVVKKAIKQQRKEKTMS